MKKYLFATAMAAVLTACNSGSGDTPINLSPTVAVTAPDTVNEGSNVQILGSVTDPEDNVSVIWTQVSGPMVNLSSTTTANTDFTAPNVNQTTDIVLRITVSDGVNPPVVNDISVSIEDSPRGGPSPQGIPDDEGRRDRARGNRNSNRPMVDSREVRTYDGTNNNIDNPDWGASFEHLQRLGNADYADGISTLAGPNRVSARVVSNTVVNQDDGVVIPNTFDGTDFVWQWGQFMDHDLDLTDGAEESADIIVPEGDAFFDPTSTGTEVIVFNRALFDPSSGTDAANPREQENEITSWIDGSMVYGSSDERAAALRDTANPAFLATSGNGLLPFNTDSLSNANGFVTDPTTLFIAGDVRINEQLGLAVMHTLFVREHNRIAQDIIDDNPALDDDSVFEQARRLVIAKIQIITYEEWLPALVGSNAVPAYTGYDDTVNPTIFNEFSVAAFRLGHSMVNQQLLRLDSSGNEIADGHVSLAAAFFTAPDILQAETDIDPILRGLATQAHQKLDEKIVHDLRNFLFGAPGAGGLDLPSLNIQRGRDHGVPSYNAMRSAMGLVPVTQFNQISSDGDVVTALTNAYDTVDDIDLWVGGLCEDATGDSQLGELFQAIIVKQFTDLRDGDRFWWETYLSPDEQNRVRNTTLSRVIRNNTDIGGELQDNVFLLP